MRNIDIYTSTGLKFFRHKSQMENYKKGYSRTIVSTHISPEGRCNLKCKYCSVIKRAKHERLELDVIKRYIEDVVDLGCKAVILTGGGEPTLYPQFDKLIHLLRSHRSGIKEIALITNGTTIPYIYMYPFSWVRVSVNYDDYWIRSFMDNSKQFGKNTTVGLSFVYSGENKRFAPDDLVTIADHINAKYIRVLPDCLQTDEEIEDSYKEIDQWLGREYDNRFFIQHKKKEAPVSNICHQSYFRPYLSEIFGGIVFPCDSIPLNDNSGYFDMKYALCVAKDIKQYMSRSIDQPFNANRDCQGCVFTHNVNMLEGFMHNDNPIWIKEKIEYENFI